MALCFPVHNGANALNMVDLLAPSVATAVHLPATSIVVKCKVHSLRPDCILFLSVFFVIAANYLGCLCSFLRACDA